MDVWNFSIDSSVQDQTRIKSIKSNKERKKNISNSSFISETAPHLLKGPQALTFCPSVESNLEDGDPLGCFF